MKRLVAVLVLTLAAVGCSPQPEPAPVVDESGFIEMIRLADSTSMFSDEELIESGLAMCDSAREQEITMTEAATNMIEYAIVEQGADESTLAYLDALFTSAGIFLCQDIA